MSEKKEYKLLKIAKELNVSILTIVNFLSKNGHKVLYSPNTNINKYLYEKLLIEYKNHKQQSSLRNSAKNIINISDYNITTKPKVVGKINLDKNKVSKNLTKPDNIYHQNKKDDIKSIKNKRVKIFKDKKIKKDDKFTNNQIKRTLNKLSNVGKSSKFNVISRLKKSKKCDKKNSHNENNAIINKNAKKLKITEFITVKELSIIASIPVNDIIKLCIDLNILVSINQRLDGDTITLIMEYFNIPIELTDAYNNDIIDEYDDDNHFKYSEDLEPRSPIVTVMGHVDHGKTSLLDYIRKTNVIDQEAGGITQHMGAYEVDIKEKNQKITFLDTPGHEAFTAMRARGAKITDIVIIVISSDSQVMPQTVEAINHALSANVPIIFAFSKIDLPINNINKIKEQLSKINILTEDWGGKYKYQSISVKKNIGINDLLETILLEADLLKLKTNYKKNAYGIVLESTLKRGLGIVTTIIIQSGILKINDYILAGQYSGRIKAIFNERNQKIYSSKASKPIQILGLQGASNAGDKFIIMNSEEKAKSIAIKRQQFSREQFLRTKKHITLDEIGRRLSIGTFKEINFILKGDMSGSIEALSDSILHLSNEQMKINIIHQSVGEISESDILLASASNAIIIGFQVKPSTKARKISESEMVEIRTYSIIYKVIEDIKLSINRLSNPENLEKLTGKMKIKEIFQSNKIGSIIGCKVIEGIVKKNSKIKIIRKNSIIYKGNISSLKSFKDNVKEVNEGHECGIKINDFNNVKVGDIVEIYT
ncbi:MAG: translation initiation factor IF-2 [Bacteroides sp.]|nr:MAG: translation initiation factor IF-2 [Bacteroides sp.]